MIRNFFSRSFQNSKSVCWKIFFFKIFYPHPAVISWIHFTQVLPGKILSSTANLQFMKVTPQFVFSVVISQKGAIRIPAAFLAHEWNKPGGRFHPLPELQYMPLSGIVSTVILANRGRITDICGYDPIRAIYGRFQAGENPETGNPGPPEARIRSCHARFRYARGTGRQLREYRSHKKADPKSPLYVPGLPLPGK